MRGIYTPQLVIDGRAELVGSRGREVTAAIRRAADAPKIPITVEATTTSGSPVMSLTAEIGGTRAAGPAGETDVWLAITESGLMTDVKAGENMFGRLHHTGVVRHLERLGPLSTPGGNGRHIRARVRLEPEWSRDDLRAVVFLQNPTTLHIAGAAQTAIDDVTPPR